MGDPLGLLEDDDDLKAARLLLAADTMELQAIQLAQIFRIQQAQREHIDQLLKQVRSYPPSVEKIADLLEKRPTYIEPTRQFIENLIQRAIAELESEDSDGGTEG